MLKLLLALISGLIFGLGIALSGMIDPAKVLNFFDLAGQWDPSLAFVMGGALTVTAVGYYFIFKKRHHPILDTIYHMPQDHNIDWKLIVGASLFGIGWGMSGFCPGGAIPALGLGYSETYIFITAMILGIVVARFLQNKIFNPS